MPHYSKDYTDHLRSLHNAVAERKAKRIELAALSYKSAAYSLGDTGAYEAAFRVEQFSQERNFPRIPPALQRLESELQRIHELLFRPGTDGQRPRSRAVWRSQTTGPVFDGHTIIVADQIPDSRMRLIEFLRRQGIRELRQVPDGSAALHMLHQIYPDLIIADWDLPKLSGLELLQAMRQDLLLKHTPMLMITGNATRREVVEAAEAGVNGYLLKPFTLTDLTRQLQRVLRPDNAQPTPGKGQHYF